MKSVFRTGGMAQMVEGLPNKPKAFNSNLSIEKEKVYLVPNKCWD
jgi:hypothetical protein